MRNLFYLVLLSFAPIFANAQDTVVGNTEIGTDSPDGKLPKDKLVLLEDYSKDNAPNELQVLMTWDALNDLILNRNALSDFGNKPSGVIVCIGPNRIFDIRNSFNQTMFRLSEEEALIIPRGSTAKLGGGMWAENGGRQSKKNIKPFTKGLDILPSINAIEYEQNGCLGTEEDSGPYVGLLVEEVLEYAPEMVVENTYQERKFIYSEETGAKEEVLVEEKYLSIDPSSLTYILINASKELLTKVEQLESEIESLKREKQSIKSFNTKTKNPLEDKAILKQNTPNPFSKTTTIQYYLPDSSRGASIRIFDLVGKELESFDLENKGNGSLDLNMEDLPNGMYIYTLIVDGQIIDSKQMILE